MSAQYDINHIFEQPFDFVVKAILYAEEKQEEEKAWQMWLMKYQHMDKKNFVPFKDFFKKMTQPVSRKPKEQILDQVARIRAKKRGE